MNSGVNHYFYLVHFTKIWFKW